MKTQTTLGYAFVLLLTAATGAAAGLQTTRDTLDKWVETRQLISKEKNDWLLEESILNDTRSLLKNELHRLKEAISELEASATAADQDREKLAQEKSDLSAASEVIAGNLAQLERQLKQIIQTLPEPLLKKSSLWCAACPTTVRCPDIDRRTRAKHRRHSQSGRQVQHDPNHHQREPRNSRGQIHPSKHALLGSRHGLLCG